MNVINNHFCIIRITAKGLTLSRPSSQKGRYKTLKMFHVAGTKPPKTVRQVVLFCLSLLFIVEFLYNWVSKHFQVECECNFCSPV